MFPWMTYNKHNCKLHTRGLHEEVLDKSLIKILTTVNQEIAESSEVFRSVASIQLERMRHLAQNYFVIHPFSTFSFIWQTWMHFVYFFAFFFIPFEACNICFTQLNPSLFVNYGTIMLMLHSIFVLDIAVQFKTGYVEHKRRLIVLNKQLIIERYLKREFLIDILTTVIALIHTFTLYFIGGIDPYPILSIINFTKILKLTTFTKYGNQIAKFCNVYGLQYVIAQFLLRSVFFFHWAACLIFFLPFITATDPVTVFSGNTWIHATQANLGTASVYEMYMESLFHATSIILREDILICTGCAVSRDPEQVNDFLISLFFSCLGLLYMCYLYIQILGIVRSLMEASTKYDIFITQLRDYLHYNHLPSFVKQRLYMLYKHRYQNIYYEEEYILNTLTDRIKKEINDVSIQRIMSQIQIFKLLDPEFIEEINDHLVLKLYLPKDIVIQARTINRYVYFISYGTVAAYTTTGKEIYHLHDGDYFGDVSLWMRDNKNMCSVIAVEICEIYQIEREIFAKAVSSKPEIVEKVGEQVKQRIKYIKAVETISQTTILKTD